MLRVSLRGIRAHIVRLLLSVLAVSLGVAFVAGTFSLRTMLGGTFDQIVDASTTADVYVKGPVFAGADAEGTSLSSVNRQVDLSLVEQIAAVDGVAQVQPETSGAIVLAGKDGTAVRAGAAPSFGLAYWPEEKGRVLVDGKPPVGASQIALEVHALEKSGLAIGDTTSIVVNGAVRTVTVVGSVDWGSATAGATLVYLDPAVAQADYAPDGTVWSIAVFAKDGVSGSELATALDAALPQTADGEHYDVQTGDEVRADSKSQVAKALGFVTTFLLIFAAISLFVGAFLISNTFAMLVRQRMRELALLRAIGASPLQVFASVLIQALVIGIVGSALGVLGGLGLVNLLKVGLQSMGMTLDGQVPLDVSTVLISVVLGTVVSLLAAGLPARRAALIPPVEAMREEVTVHERSLRVRAMAGLLLAVAGAAAVTASALDLVENRNVILGVGATGVVIGVLMIAPTIARTAVTVLAAPLSRVFRPMTRLAAGNVVRNPRRTANTAGALMIGMALVGAVSVLAASATASTSSIVDEGTNADLVLRPALGLSTPAKAVDEVKVLPELSAVDEFVVGTMSVQLPGETSASSSMVGGFTPEMIGRGLVVKDVEGSSVGALTSGEAIVKVDQATSNDWSLGDKITLQGPTGESRTVAIGAIIDAPVVDVPVVVAVDILDALVPPSQQWIGTVFLTVADGVSVTEARAAVTDVVKPYIVISVMDRQDFVDSLADQVNQMLAILYALLGLSVIVAILGIVNTLALSVIERTREIGLLRAVGLGRLQLTGTIMIESVITAVFGTFVGLAVGVGLAAALPRIYADQGLRELAIPWASLGLFMAGSVLVGVLAALWPGIRAARLPVLDAISQE